MLHYFLVTDTRTQLLRDELAVLCTRIAALREHRWQQLPGFDAELQQPGRIEVKQDPPPPPINLDPFALAKPNPDLAVIEARLDLMEHEKRGLAMRIAELEGHNATRLNVSPIVEGAPTLGSVSSDVKPTPGADDHFAQPNHGHDDFDLYPGAIPGPLTPT